MNLYNDPARKVEAELKQRTLQLDNLHNALSSAKKEAADQKQAREAAEQEAYRCSKLLAAAEDDRAKLQKEVKQRNEYASSLSAQVDAKTRSNEQHEKDARAAKAESLRLATALEDAELKKKAMASEVTKLTTNLETLDKQLNTAKAAQASRVAELAADLQRARSEAQAQAAEIERFRALAKSGHIDADNMHAAVANMRAELQQKEQLLKGESATSNAALSQLETELTSSKRAAEQSSSKLGHLDAALAAEKAKRAAAEARCAEVDASLQALTGERDQLVADLRGARATGSAAEQHGVQLAALQRRAAESEGEVKALQQMLATAAAEIDTLQQAVKEGSASKEALSVRLANVDAVLSKRQRRSSGGAQLKNAADAVQELEAEVARLRAEAKDAAHANESLRGKVQRSMEAVEAAVAVQGKLEAKYAKLADKRAAEQQELQAARAKAAELQTCLDNAKAQLEKERAAPSGDGDALAGAAAAQKDEIEALKFANERLTEKAQRQAKALQEFDSKLRASAQAAEEGGAKLREAAERTAAEAAAAKEARDRAAQLEAQMAMLRANADAAVANAAPPPPDDTAARRAAQLSEEVAAQQRAALEAVKHAAQLEHALESKAAAQAAVQAELVAAQDEKAAVVKDLQSAQKEAAESLLEQKRLREQVGKADAALSKLQQQLADVKEELAERVAAVAAAVADKDAFAAEAASARSEAATVQAALSHAKSSAAEAQESKRRSVPVLTMASPADEGLKQKVAELRAQLREEEGKHRRAKEALLAEQSHFASELARLEDLTRGEAADTPGGAVHAQLQRIQRQLSAVQGGGDVAAVQHRSMLTPPAAATPPAATLPRLTPVPLSRPATAASLPRPGTASTVATNRTPLSALNSVANEQGEFWHRRFEEQAVRLSTTEAEKRDLEIRLARAGAPVRSQGTPRTAAARTPVSRRVTIGGAGTASRCALLSPCMVGEAEAAAATGGAAAAAPEALPGPDVKRKIAFDDTEGEKRAAPSPHVECSGSRENVGADVNLAAPPRSEGSLTPQFGQ